MASILPPGSRIIGVDINQEFLDKATIEMEKVKSELKGVTVEFKKMEATHLEFPDSQFEAMRIERVLQHIKEPRKVLEEVHRVLKSNGRFLAMEGHRDGIIYYTDDPLLKEVNATVKQSMSFASDSIGVQLPLLCQQIQFQDIKVEPAVFLVTSPTQFDVGLTRTSYALDNLVKKGLLNQQAKEEFIKKLLDMKPFEMMCTSTWFITSVVKGM